MTEPTLHALGLRLDRLERERQISRTPSFRARVAWWSGQAWPWTGGVVPLMLNDTMGTVRAVLGDTGLRLVASDVTEQRQPPSIVFFDEGGKVLWKAP